MTLKTGYNKCYIICDSKETTIYTVGKTLQAMYNALAHLPTDARLLPCTSELYAKANKLGGAKVSWSVVDGIAQWEGTP